MDVWKGGEEDFITKLPNDVVGHILSYLTTKEAVQTSVLSRKWRYLWTYIHSLDFHDDHFPLMKSRYHSFMDFVDQVLGILGSKNIQIFTLRFYRFQRQSDLNRVNAWIHYALSCNVKELDLFLLDGYGDRIPVNFSSCKSLVVLKLGNDFVFTNPSTIECFPSLKVLHVEARHPDCEFLSRLLCSCPILEDLSMYGNLEQHGDDQVKHTFRISIPTLKRLKIDLSADGFGYRSDHEFIIQTPNLEYLTIQKASLAYFVIDEIPSLLEAKVSIGHSTYFHKYQVTQKEFHGAMEILKGIRNAKFLTLSDSSTAALSFAFDDDLPTFPFLLRLELGIDNFFGWKLLPYFLRNSPVLEFLVLERENMERLIETLDESDRELDVEVNFGWIQPKSAPYCLLQHLKEIKMRYLWRSEDEVEVIKYLLKNGEVLEKMCIVFDDNASEEKLDKDMIEKFPRGSDNCIIEFV